MDVGALVVAAAKLAQEQRLAEAEQLLRQAVKDDPQFGDAHHDLGVVLQLSDRPAEALDALTVAVKLQPADIGTRIVLAQTLMQLNRPVEAAAHCSAALQSRPDQPEAHGLLAEALLMSGDFRRGWAEYEWRWKCGTFKEPRRQFPRPQWRGAGEKLYRKTILIWHEQGFGDVIQCIRYAPMLADRGARVIVEAPPGLSELLRHVKGVAEVTVAGAPSSGFDLHIPVMSLPLAFGTKLATIPANVPYVKPAPKVVEVWRGRMGEKSGLRVGVAWAARRGDDLRSRRKSIPLSALNRLGQSATDKSGARVSFFSLQRDTSAADLSRDAPALNLVDLTSKLADFSDSAAIIANLDLVISVDTSVAHLAGAMGKPVWVLLPFAGDFRWLLHRPDTPWYPTMRLFRQRAAGDWDGVVDQVIGQLLSFIVAHNS